MKFDPLLPHLPPEPPPWRGPLMVVMLCTAVPVVLALILTWCGY